MPRIAIISALLLACLPVPAMVEGQPTLYEQAVAERLSGNPERAVIMLQSWLEAHPDDADARVQLGYALLALGRPSEAQSEFRRTLDRSPEYRDAQDGLELASKRLTPEESQTAHILVEGAISKLDADLPDWREVGATAQLPLTRSSNLALAGTSYRRFSRDDFEIATGLTYRASQDSWVRGSVTATVSADFRPEIGANFGVDHRVVAGANATVFGFDTGWRKFPSQDVWNVSPLLTQYVANGRALATVRANFLVAEDDALRVGGFGRLDLYPDERSRAFVGGAFGPDTELGIVTDTVSLFGGGELPLTGQLTLTGGIAREWREGPADRTDLRVGLKVAL